MRVDWRQIVPALLLGCLIGIWGGAWLHRAALHHMRTRVSDTQQLLDRVNAELKLDAGQQVVVKAVLESYRTQMKTLHEENIKHIEEIRASMRGDLAKLLNPEQQKRFQDLQARWDSRHKNWKDALPHH
jgi:hypothetical protein